MLTVTKALFLVPLVVNAFGATKDHHDACDKCICSNDYGDIDDPDQKKCCPTEAGYWPSKWDAFCDSLMMETCNEECTEDGESTSTREHTGLGFRSGAGAGRGMTCSAQVSCSQPFVCLPGFYQNTCSTFSEAVKGILATESQTLLGLGAGEVVVPKISNPQVRDSVIFGTNQPLSAQQLADLKLALSTRFGLTLPDIIARGASGRRQLLAVPAYQYMIPNPYASGGMYGETDYTQGDKPASAAGIAMAKTLYDNGVRLLTFDWDKTACDEHTYQQSYASLDHIVSVVSRDYIETVNAWCQEYPTLPTAIVTYNDVALTIRNNRPSQVNGPDAIKMALDEALNPSCAAKLKIYARNDSRRGGGKNWHLQQAQRGSGGLYSNGQTILVDDTSNNIVEALKKSPSYQTIWVNPDHGFKYSNYNSYYNKCPTGKSCTAGSMYGRGRGGWGR